MLALGMRQHAASSDRRLRRHGDDAASRSLLTRLQPAGVILFARNIKSAEQTWRLLRDCQTCVATPLFTCVDLEGGSVDRFRDLLGLRLRPLMCSPPAIANFFAGTDR